MALSLSFKLVLATVLSLATASLFMAPGWGARTSFDVAIVAIIWIPAWLMAMMLVIEVHKQRRTRRLQCPECGYDLAATRALHPGCPECGWARPERGAVE